MNGKSPMGAQQKSTDKVPIRNRSLIAARHVFQVCENALVVIASLYVIMLSHRAFGEVMAHTRNNGGMNEKFGTYDQYPAFLKRVKSLTEIAPKEIL